MADNLSEELLRNQVRAHLRAQNVKLWTLPFIETDGKPNVQRLESLADEYSLTLHLERNACLHMLVSLQENSLKRVKEQEQFDAHGLATLQVRLSGFSSATNSSSPFTGALPQEGNSKNEVQVELSINSSGSDLKNVVSQLSGQPADRFKLIFNGRIILNDKTLKEQGLKNSSRIMALALNANPNEVDEALEYQRVFERTRSAASTLSKRSKHQYASLELENQTGSSLRVDQKEKEALCLALTLHERGRAFLKRGNHALAFLLFLEADKEYGCCDSDILNSVDNVALLQLDIVWCYLCLRSISHIPDAERRLTRCANILERTYGKNLERVEAIKGSGGNEAVSLMRLHLLQAIVAFHLNKIESAKDLLLKAEIELKSLKVNPDDMTQILALGYSSSEALMGLRACHGDVNAAVSQICEWQQERIKAREENQREKKRDRERLKLGKTADGSQYIEPDCVQTLSGMGYDRDLAISALKHSNNNITQAVHLLQEQPHLLDGKKKRLRTEDIAQIAAMGFDVDVARLALFKHNGSLQEAVADLITNNGIVAVNPEEFPPDLEVSTSDNVLENESEDSWEDVEEDNNEAGQSSSQTSDKSRKRKEQTEAAFELENDIPEVENDHLCVTLEAEEQFLQEYKSLLNM